MYSLKKKKGNSSTQALPPYDTSLINPKECLLNLFKPTGVDDDQKVVRQFVPMQTKFIDVPLNSLMKDMKSDLKLKNHNLVLSVSIPVDRCINY